MGLQPLRVDLSTPGKREIVADGNVVNGINLVGIPAGVQVYLVLGRNPRIGPVSDGPFTFGPGTDPLDVSLGAWLENDTAYPGVIVGGFVSFAPPRSLGANAQGISLGV